MIPDKEYIIDSHSLIRKYIHHTPLLESQSINKSIGARILFKAENFQRAGAFKYRGACNAVLRLSEESKSLGVATHSSGNHAQALAKAAKMQGIKAHIVMPETAKQIKIKGVQASAANIYFCEPTLEGRENKLKEVIQRTSAIEIHPYNNYDIIAGQASCAKEIFESSENFDLLLCPVGGGGLLSGSLLSRKYFSPDTKLIAVEPEAANDAYRSFHFGIYHPSINPNTIADGLLTSLGEKNWDIIQNELDDIVCVSDESIILAMRLIWERLKIIVEASSAVVLAAFLENKIDTIKYKNIAAILSGGNVDIRSYFSSLQEKNK